MSKNIYINTDKNEWKMDISNIELLDLSKSILSNVVIFLLI